LSFVSGHEFSQDCASDALQFIQMTKSKVFLKNAVKGSAVFIVTRIGDLLKDRYIGAINRWLDIHASGPLRYAASWIVNRPWALTILGMAIFLAVLLLHAFVVTKNRSGTTTAENQKGAIKLSDIPSQGNEVLIRAQSDDEPFGKPQQWPRPNLSIYGPQFCAGLGCCDDEVWRLKRTGGLIALVCSVKNDMHQDGTGAVASGVRVQTAFTYKSGAHGPSFSAVPWIGERYAITDIPAGTQKEFLSGIKNGPGGQGYGWTGYANRRLGPEHATETGVMRSFDLPDDGMMEIKVIALIGDEATLLHESYFSWKISFDLNHPQWMQIPKPQ
jgi:hypothetical protein